MLLSEGKKKKKTSRVDIIGSIQVSENLIVSTTLIMIFGTFYNEQSIAT